MTNISGFDPDGRTAVVDLTDAYALNRGVTRRFTLPADYTQLVITDRVDPERSNDGAAATMTMSWSMHTYADITVDPDGRGATLVQKGRRLRATVGAAEKSLPGRFTAVDLNITSLPSNQTTKFNASPGLRKLVFDSPRVASIEVTLRLSPVVELHS